MEKQNAPQEVVVKTRVIDYVTLGLSIVTTLGTAYIILDSAGVFKKKEKKETNK